MAYTEKEIFRKEVQWTLKKLYICKDCTFVVWGSFWRRRMWCQSLLNIAACIMERELQDFHVSEDFEPLLMPCGVV